VDEASPPKKPYMLPRTLPYVFHFSDQLEVQPKELYGVGLNDFCNILVPVIKG